MSPKKKPKKNSVTQVQPVESSVETESVGLASSLSAQIKAAKNLDPQEVRARLQRRSGQVVTKPSNPRSRRPMIQVKDLHKVYGDVAAVDGVTFDVKKGEIFGILGPNGAGKTTTLEIMEAMLIKTSGKILLDGLDVDEYPVQVKKIVGVQLQDEGFFPGITLVETLKFLASMYEVTIDPMDLLRKVSLEDKARSKVNQLSGGQRRRFSVATTLVGNPSIVFLDEPTTGLDPQARRSVWDLILDLKTEGKTVVLTTHYMDEAEYLCDRIAIMDKGKILEVNTAEGFIGELLARGFTKPQPKYGATLEDVFLELTGKYLRE